jgi:multidrug resistance efflux pump
VSLEKAQRDFTRLRDKHENSQKLYENNFKSRNDLELDYIAMIDADAKREQAVLAQQIYEDYEHPREEKQKISDLEEANAELERVTKQNESQLASKNADHSHRKRQYEIRYEGLQDLHDQLAKTTITAPKDGLVVYWASAQGRRWDDDRGTLQVGREVNPRETLIVLPDTTEMIASVQVHESIAGRVRPGQAAVIHGDWTY